MAREWWILAGAHKGKKITVTKYNKHAAGLEIKIEHNATSRAGFQLPWVQTIMENGSFFKACKLPNYVDPWGPSGALDPKGNAVCKADDDKPFYWTDSEFTGGQGPGMYDKPSEGAPASGRTWIQFTTSLTEAKDKNVAILVTIAWGFDRMADGRVLAAAIRRANATEMSNHLKALKAMYGSYSFKYAT